MGNNLLGRSNTHIFGVADGHGKYGREIASTANLMFPTIVEAKLRQDDMKQVLANSFHTLNMDVRAIHTTKSDFSGTCLCTVTIKGRTLYAANVGDSRAILIGANEILQLTR